MTPGRFHLVSQVGRVPSMTVRLDGQQEVRFQRLMEESIMIDLHQHPMVLPEDFSRYWEYLRSNSYVWGYDAVSCRQRRCWPSTTPSNSAGGRQRRRQAGQFLAI